MTFPTDNVVVSEGFVLLFTFNNKPLTSDCEKPGNIWPQCSRRLSVRRNSLSASDLLKITSDHVEPETYDRQANRANIIRHREVPGCRGLHRETLRAKGVGRGEQVSLPEKKRAKS